MHFLMRIALLVAIGLALLAWMAARRAGDRFGSWLGALIAIAFVVELVAFVMREIPVPNTILYNAFGIVEFLVFLRLVAFMEPLQREALVITAVIGLGAMAGSYALHKDLDFLLTEGMIVMAALLVGWSLLVLWRLAQRSGEPLWRLPVFWLFMGALVYFGGIVPFVGMMRYLYQNDLQSSRLLYLIILVMAVLRYLFTAWACSLARSRQVWHEHGHQR